MKDIRKNQMESYQLTITMTKIKASLEGLNRKIKMILCEFQVISIKIIQSKQQGEMIILKCEQDLRELLSNNSTMKICIFRVPRNSDDKECGAKNSFKK